MAIVHCKGVDNVFAMTFNYFCNCNYHIHELSFYFFTLITLCSFKFLYFNFKFFFIFQFLNVDRKRIKSSKKDERESFGSTTFQS